MDFKLLLGLRDIPEHKTIVCRKAVRAVIFKDSLLLMVQNNKGDYKFPGGGVNGDEQLSTALKREVKEETGRVIKTIFRQLGEIVERKIDAYDANAVFESLSYYYLSDITNIQQKLELDDYEVKLGFAPVWVRLDEALKNNIDLVR